jgi:hypothetical protein
VHLRGIRRHESLCGQVKVLDFILAKLLPPDMASTLKASITERAFLLKESGFNC